MPFSEESLKFLVENRARDNREWYLANKDRYQNVVVAPMVDLVKKLTPAMLQIDPQFIMDPRVDRTISRIYRDTRFSKDKSLYRDNCWAIFIRDRKNQGLPAYYFDLSPSGFSYGVGYYETPPAVMKIIREMILEGDPVAKAAMEALKKSPAFHAEGEEYKRPKYPDQPEAMRIWLEKRNISINTHNDDMSVLFSETLHELLIDGYKGIAPVYRFFCDAEAKVIREQ